MRSEKAVGSGSGATATMFRLLQGQRRPRCDCHPRHSQRKRRMPAPKAQGLYDPAFEHDACGVGFVADMHGRRSHEIVRLGLSTLCKLDHRGATNAEANVGDGAGLLIQVPDRFLREVVDFELPAAGSYAVGMAFLPKAR